MQDRIQQIATHFEQSSKMSKTPELTLYTAQSPNSIKISIALHILSLPYKPHPISLFKHEQKAPWFTAINPNGRIPALTDHSPPFSAEPLHIMESGAILLYLASTYDSARKISFEENTREHWEMVQWVLWQNAELGPMQGQANHFYRYAPERVQYGIDWYIKESRRLYSILEKRLVEQEGKGGWIVGDHVSVADIAVFGWAIIAEWAGVGLDEFPAVRKWIEQMEAVEGVEEGRNVPEPSRLRGIMGDKKKMDEFAAMSNKWILEGMGKDAEKKDAKEKA